MTPIALHLPLPMLCRRAGDKLRRGGHPLEGELFHMAAERMTELAAALRTKADRALDADPFGPDADDVGDYD